MTRTFICTFTRLRKKDGTDGRNQDDWCREEITLIKKVTDRMEERGYSHKFGYALHYFNQVLRDRYGYHRDVVFVKDVKEITKGETR